MDYNNLHSNAFSFSLHRLPDTTFRVVELTLPGISITPVNSGYPSGSQYFPGSAVEFEPLQVTFVVDENLKNYQEIYRWITQQRYNEQVYTPTSPEETFLVSDGTVITMTNASNPNRVFSFKDLFPIDLGPIQFNTRDSTPEIVTCTVTFRFAYFTLEY